MACNLLNHESELKQAIGGVSNDKLGSAWCIFEYEGNSNIIRVGCIGNNGIEELAENFRAAKVQYGFVAIKCENLTKIVLIHWQGDGVPLIRRSQTMPHLTEVQRFARLVHLTIYARSEEDIEPSAIHEQLTKSAKANTTIPPAVTPKPVATVSQLAAISTNGNDEPVTKITRAWVPPPPKTIIAMNTVSSDHSIVDVSLDERTKFWQEMRAEEEQRRKDDLIRQEEQHKQYSLERRQLEIQLHEALLAKNAAVAAQKLYNGAVAPHKKRSDLIAGKRLIFEQKLAEIAATVPKPLAKQKNFKFQVGVTKQNTITSQQNAGGPEPPKERIETPNVKSILQQFQQSIQQQQNNTKMNEEKQEQHINSMNNQEQQQQQREEMKYEEQASTELPILVVQPMLKIDTPDNPDQHDLVKQTEFSIEKTSCSESICVKALWDYQAEDDSEITFDPGDIITDVEMVHEDWWRGRNKNDEIGLFPSNFVELL